MDETYDNIRDFKSEVESFRLENDNLKRENEKITIDYELKIENLKKEISLKSVNYDNLMINFQELDAKYKNSCKEKIEINQNYFDLSQEKFNVVKKFDNLESEHNSLLELISRREREVINCKNEIQELKSQLIEYKNKEIEMKLNRNDLEFRRKDFDRMEEVSLLRNKKLSDDIKSLEDKLLECKKQNFEDKSQHNKELYDLNLEMESKRNEIKNQKKVVEKLKEKISHLEKVNEEKTESLRAAVETQTSIDNLLRKELTVQMSISDLHKEERDECLNREKNLISVITELQESLKETYDESEKMKSEFETKLNEYSHRLSELRQELNRKEKELFNANELMDKFRVKGLSEDEMKAMNPATSAAISALKRGYSMTQIYSEYLQIVNERDELRVDRDRLNEYMVTILDELEQKAPLLKKQQDEHANLELSVSVLSKKYDDNLSQLLSCQSESEDYRKRCDDLTKKLKREEQTCADLGQQVCCLLREIETFRGTVIRSNDPFYGLDNEPELITRMKRFQQRSLMHNMSQSSVGGANFNESFSSSSKYVTSKDIITTHLVTFKNICELQQQNIQLLEQVRDLSEQHEATENLINENSMQDLAKKLEQSYREIEEIREKQKQNKQLVKTINAQRHIIQALSMFDSKGDMSLILENSVLTMDSQDDISHSMITINDGTGDKRINNTSMMNTISSLNGKIIEYQEKLDKMQSEIDALKDDKETLREKHHEITEELNQLLSDSKITNANLLAKLSFNQEKTASLEQNLVNRQLELLDLQTELTETVKQLAQKSEESKSLTFDLMNKQNKLKDVEAECKKLQQNMRSIASLEEQIKMEKAEKLQCLMTMNNMAAQVGNLQAAVAKPQVDQSGEEELELKSRIKQLNLELKQEKSKYQNSMEIWQAKFNESQSKIDSLASQLNNITQSSSTTTSLVISEPCTVGILQSSSEKREKTNDFENQLEDLTVSNYSLKRQLESYQDLMSNSESKLISNAQLIEEMERKFQEKIAEERQKNDEAQLIIVDIRIAYEEMESEYKNVKNNLENQIEKILKKLDDKNEVIENLQTSLANAEAVEAQLKIDLDRQRKLTKEATENYQQELIFHAQESDTLNEVMEKVNSFKKQERDLTEKLQEATLARNQYQMELDKRDSIWIEEKRILENEISELRNQKDSLNNRLIDLNDNVVNLKKMLDPSIECGIDHAVIQQESDWNEVIQYLRQQKDSAEKIKNQSEIDVHRLKAQCCQQEEQIQQLNNALEEERKYKVLEAETSKQHAEVMRQLELRQMLSESNAMLRQDRERLKEELSEKTKKLAQLQEIVDPLKADLKDKNSEIESVKLDVRSLENERDLWRRRCDALIEKSKQVNPEDFNQICMEKNELQHQLLLEEDRYRMQVAKTDELHEEIESHLKSIKNIEDQMDTLKKINDENLNAIQKRDGMITQLKEIGRKYRAETESLHNDISKHKEDREELIREIESLKRELLGIKISFEDTQRRLQNQNATSSNSNFVSTDEFIRKISSILQCQGNTADIIDSADKLMKENQNKVQFFEKGDSEQKLRNQVMEGQISKLKLDNERLKKQLESNRHSMNVHSLNNEEDNPLTEESISDVLQTTTTWHTVPTVARVAANVHPVVQKPQNIISGSNQISPNSQPVPTCISTARQTAEIRPIHAVSLHMVPSSTPVEASDSLSTASVTTSLPANVVQALAASSVSSVIFPTVTGFPTTSGISSNTSTNTNRLKRCYDDTLETDSRLLSVDQQPSSSDQQNIVKKIRIRASEPSVQGTQELFNLDHQDQDLDAGIIDYNNMNDGDEMCEREIEIESQNVDQIPLTTDDESLEHLNETNEAFFDNTAEEKPENFSEEEEEQRQISDDVEDDYEDIDYDENEDEDDENEEDHDGEEEEGDGDSDEPADDDEDDDNDDDDGDNDVIELSSSDDDDDNNNDNNNSHRDSDSKDQGNNEDSDNGENDDEDNTAGQSSNMRDDKSMSGVEEDFKQQESELEQAKKKIQPIVWGDNYQKKNFIISKKQTFITSPQKLGQPIKSRCLTNVGYRRKVRSPRRGFPFSAVGTRGMSQIGRRSGGPFKGNYPR